MRIFVFMSRFTVIRASYIFHFEVILWILKRLSMEKNGKEEIIRE